MSKRSRTLNRTRARLSGETKPVTKVKSAGDLLAIIPYLLGFAPTESLVVLSLQGERRRVGPCMRADLVGVDEVAGLVDYLLSVIAHHRFTRVLLVAYTADEDQAAAVIQPLLERLREQGVGVTEALRADGERWWSYTCDDPLCCGPDGSEYDVETSQVAADAVLSGMSKAPDRESLRATFEPHGVDRRWALDAECERQRGIGGHAAGPALTRRGLEQLIATHLDDPELMTLPDVARLLLAVQDLALRDVAWFLISRADADRHLRLWSHLMRSAPDRLMPPAGALAGFAAWIGGNGALACVAVDRLAAVSPRYSLGLLLRDVLIGTVNPEVWEEHRGRQNGPPSRDMP